MCYRRELRAYIRESFRKEDCYYNSQMDVFRKQRCLGGYYDSSDLNLGRINSCGVEANNWSDGNHCKKKNWVEGKI